MDIVFSKTPGYGMVSARSRNLSLRRASIGFLTQPMNEFDQKRLFRVKACCLRTDLGFPRATQVIKLDELIPCEKDPILSSGASCIRNSPKRLIRGDAPRCKDTRLPRGLYIRSPCMVYTNNGTNPMSFDLSKHTEPWKRTY